MTKTERRLKRIEDRLDALEKALPVTGWTEEEPPTQIVSIASEEAILPEPPPGPFGVTEELREEAHEVSHDPPRQGRVREKGDKSPQKKPEKASEERIEKAREPIAILEEKAYTLHEAGLEWSEVEEELGLKSPWLAAGRYRKRLERGEG